MRCFIVLCVSVFLLGGGGFFRLGDGGARTVAAADAVEVPDEGAGPPGFFDDMVRIDGQSVTSAVRLVAKFEDESGSGDDEGSESLTAPTATVIMDAWTQRVETGQTGEDYDFIVGEAVQFVVFVKVGENGIPGGASMDFVLVPAGITRMPPIPALVLFVDDVWFAPIAPGPVRLFVFTIQIPNLQTVFPAGSCIDWFAAADFNATTNADADLNGLPDCCIEANPAVFLEAFSADVDNVGATVLRFFNPGQAPLNVFQAHPPFPGAKAIGAKPGEDSLTRPWSFTIR